MVTVDLLCSFMFVTQGEYTQLTELIVISHSGTENSEFTDKLCWTCFQEFSSGVFIWICEQMEYFTAYIMLTARTKTLIYKFLLLYVLMNIYAFWTNILWFMIVFFSELWLSSWLEAEYNLTYAWEESFGLWFYVGIHMEKKNSFLK